MSFKEIYTAISIYMPFIHFLQCHPALDGQRGKCWCVERKTGVKLNPAYDPLSDPDCQLASELIRK